MIPEGTWLANLHWWKTHFPEHLVDYNSQQVIICTKGESSDEGKTTRTH